MRADEVALIGALAHRLPFLRPVLQQHLDDWEGLLTHLFMGDLCRWLVAERSLDAGSPRLQQTFDELERLYVDGTEHERELLYVSFLENLPNPDEPEHELADLLGPALRKEYDEMHGR